MMNSFKENEIVILLGAGASVDAGIPHSNQMISNVEQLLLGEWKEFADLYHFIKSSIKYSDGINGKFDHLSTFNIERFVNTLDEIKKKKDHVLFPFVGAWNPTLEEVAGQNFENIGKFRKEIVNKLRSSWISLTNYKKAQYFTHLENLQEEYNFPLRVFTLNYDLCVEKNCSSERIERGFNEEMVWDWKKFDDSIPDHKNMYLYKLHGSIDWYYEDNLLKCSDEIGKVDDESSAIIFGTTYKFQYRDPFLFFAYEFRKYSLESMLILSIGYGFGDDHINQIIKQALNQDPNRKLISVSPIQAGETDEVQRNKISNALQITNKNQICICSIKAKEFFETKLTIDYLKEFFPDTNDEVFSIVP